MLDGCACLQVSPVFFTEGSSNAMYSPRLREPLAIGRLPRKKLDHRGEAIKAQSKTWNAAAALETQVRQRRAPERPTQARHGGGLANRALQESQRLPVLQLDRLDASHVVEVPHMLSLSSSHSQVSPPSPQFPNNNNNNNPPGCWRPDPGTWPCSQTWRLGPPPSVPAICEARD